MHLMTHEGIESPFEVDATEAIKPGATNRLAVRILNVTGTPIDGLSVANTPLGYVQNSWTPGYAYNAGGIIAPVCLELTPPVYVQNVFAQPNRKTGEVAVKATIINTGTKEPARPGRLQGNAGAGRQLGLTTLRATGASTRA